MPGGTGRARAVSDGFPTAWLSDVGAVPVSDSKRWASVSPATADVESPGAACAKNSSPFL